jgi:hypothetical protein
MGLESLQKHTFLKQTNSNRWIFVSYFNRKKNQTDRRTATIQKIKFLYVLRIFRI